MLGALSAAQSAGARAAGADGAAVIVIWAEMSELAITAAVILAVICFLATGWFALRVVRVRGGSQPPWHLLVASPRYLDLSRYPPQSVLLAVTFRRCGCLGIACLALAGLLRVVN